MASLPRYEIAPQPVWKSPLAAPIATGCCLALGAAYVAAVDPAQGGAFVPCPFHAITGLWCPGCGLTRATHQLLHGHLEQGLHDNLLAPFVLMLIVASWLAWLLDSTGARPRRRRLPGWATAVAIVIALAFGVVRNLPGVTGLRG